MNSLSVLAPAKINLSLKILGKREDGFHELETVMVPVKGLADTLLFKESEGFSFHCDAAGVPTDESNLVVKAVRAFERESGLSVKHSITLEKVIPHGAGLGGGSSDAASCLLALNELYAAPLSFRTLHALAAELGADVPFFLYKSACICRGKGELVEPLLSAASFTMVLLKPSFGVSTKDAFKRWLDSSELSGIPYATQKGPYGEMVNDLERPVFEKFLFLADFKKWLLTQSGVSVAQMSGSGSTMIAIVDSLNAADALIDKAKNECDPHLFTWAGEVL